MGFNLFVTRVPGIRVPVHYNTGSLLRLLIQTISTRFMKI